MQYAFNLSINIAESGNLLNLGRHSFKAEFIFCLSQINSSKSDETTLSMWMQILEENDFFGTQSNYLKT